MARVRFREGKRRRPRLLGIQFDREGVSRIEFPEGSAVLRRAARRPVGRRLLEVVTDADESLQPDALPVDEVIPPLAAGGDSPDEDVEAVEVVDLGDDAAEEDDAEPVDEPEAPKRKRGRPRKNG